MIIIYQKHITQIRGYTLLYILIIPPVIMFGRISTANTKQTQLIIQQKTNRTIVVGEIALARGTQRRFPPKYIENTF